MICTHCSGTGFLNLEQVPAEDGVDLCDVDAVQKWIDEHDDHDVSVCDCCGDGADWHGVPGEHYGVDDPPGPSGPYAYNGGLCECD